MRKQLQSPTSHGAKLGSPVRRRARVGTRGEPEGKPEGSPRRARGKPEGAVAEPPWRSRRGGATVADNRGRVAVTESPWRSHRGRRARGEPEGSPRGAGSRGRQPWQANRRASGESEGSRASRGRQPWTREPVPGSPGGFCQQKLSALDLFSPPVTRGNIIGKKRIKSDTSRAPVGGGGTSGGRQTVLGWWFGASALAPTV